MILDSTAADNVTLDLAKKHLYVSHDLDDTIIQSYIEASKGIVEDFIHAKVLISSYIASSEELVPIDGKLVLSLQEEPYKVEIQSNLGGEELPMGYYEYENQVLTIDTEMLPGRAITAVTAGTGKKLQEEQIRQARLLLIGTYYAFRENSVALRMSELPDGVQMILKNCSEPSL